MSLATDIARIAIDRPKLQNIVNGDASTTVVTDGGQVPSFARLLSQMGAGTIKGAWVTATAYVLGDVVTNGGTAYRCIVAHTSAAALATDLAASKWIVHYTATSTVDTIAALRAAGNTYGTILVLGYYSAGDACGPRLYRWNGADVTTDNGGSVIGSGTGRWNLLNPTPGLVNVRHFGAKGDGATDDSAAFIAAAATLTVNSKLYHPPGNYALSSAALAATPIYLPADGITLQGEGRGVSVITVTGASVVPFIFSFRGRSTCAAANLSFFGNNQANAFGNGAALNWTNAGASGVIKGMHVRDCHFENFKSDFWIYVENILGTYPMFDVNVSDNTFTSASGNSRGPTNIAIPQGCVGIFGHSTTAGGSVNDIVISGNVARCQYMKGFALLFNQVNHYAIEQNVVYGSGTDAAFADDSACYALMVYSAVLYNPLNGIVSNNQIYGVRDCGIYLLDNTNVTVSGNAIMNQTSTADTSLPKAAIAINGGRLETVTGNTIEGCNVGIYFQGNRVTSNNSESVIASNTISGAGKYGLNIESSSYGWNGLVVSDNMIRSNAMGIQVNVNAASPVYDLKISDNQIYAATTAINIQSGNATYNLSDCHLDSNKFYSSGSLSVGISCVSFPNTLLNINGNSFNNAVTGNWLDIRSTKKVNITNNIFSNVSGGTCFNATGAEGNLWDNIFFNTALANISSNSGGQDLGRIKPTWTGVFSTRVQNLNPQEAGAASSKYVVQGWVYNAGWLDQRTLTGN